MSEPRVVTPQEARAEFDSLATFLHPTERERSRRDLAHTVATAPEREKVRTRAAVVKALRDEARKMLSTIHNPASDYAQAIRDMAGEVLATADAIENGANW